MPAPTKPQKSPDANVEKVVDLMRSRSVIGLEKYKVTTERTDLTPLEWVRHWQAENADATIYAEKLVEVVTRLEGKNLALMSREVHLTGELNVLRKAVSEAGRFLLIGANRYTDGNDTETRAAMTMAASALGVELQWPKSTNRVEKDKAFVNAFNAGHDAKHAKLQSAADRARERVSGYSPSKRAELLKQGKATANSRAPDPSPIPEQWNDAKTTPPAVGHAVIGMVNGTTKTRAVYYVANTGKWVDVNDRPVTVSQWRHL